MITTKRFPSLIRFSIVLAILLATVVKIQAQSEAKDSIYIDNDGVFTIDSDVYYFGSGMVSTSRSHSDYGVLSFEKGSWQGASDANYVDGYAETMLNTIFTFPIGQSGIYAPAQVTPTSEDGVDAAYFRADPAQIGNAKNSTLQSLSNVEYWDLRATDSVAGIALSWRPSSELASWLGGGLNELTIVGWDGTNWMPIPSSVEEVSFEDQKSTIDSGSIRSNGNINLKAYSAFSLGGSTSKLTIPKFNPISLTTFINKSHFYLESNSRIKAFTIYDITGKRVATIPLPGSLKWDMPFYHEEGVYIVKIELEDGAIQLVKKIINSK